MADNDSFEVEIVDDGYTPVEDDHLSSFSDDNGDNAQTAEQKAAAQAKAEQDADPGSEKLTSKQRRDKAKERINELTRKYRDEERKRVDLEREREQERTQFQTQVQTFQQAQVENAKVVYGTLASNKRLLEANLAMARDRGDTKTENQIQDQLTEAREKMGRLKQHYPGVDAEGAAPAPQQQTAWQQPQGTQPHPQSQTQQPQAGQLPDAARAWVESNNFLKARQDLHPTIEGVRELLVRKGMDSTKPEFYQELTRRLKAELPEDVASQLKSEAQLDDDWDSLLGGDEDANDDDQLDAGQQSRQEQQPRPQQQQTVGDGGRAAPRTQGGKRKIKLTREQVQLADRMGITREAYAAQLARQQNTTGYTEIGD